MWPFTDRTRDLARAFGRYLSRGQLSAIKECSDLPLPERGFRQFLLIQASDEVLDDIPLRLSKVVEILVGEGCAVDAMMASFLLVNVPMETRAENVAELLLKAAGHDVRILVGRADTLRGFMGGAESFTFGQMIGGFGNAVQMLLCIPFGTARSM